MSRIYGGKITSTVKGYNKDPIRTNSPGQIFFMDYGYIRGKDATQTKDGPLVISKDGCDFYLLIVDKFSRHLWVFFSRTKSLQLSQLLLFFFKHGTKLGLKWVCTDQRG